MSKSAKRRAAKKAREAGDEPAAPAAPAPPAPPAPKAGGYPAEPAPKAKAKAKAAPAPEPAKAEPKAKAKAKAEPKAEPKASAKAKAKAEPAPPPPEQPQASAKSKSKKKGENKENANPQPPKEEPMKKQHSPGIPVVQMDDGTGGDWDVCTGLSKKQQKYKERKDEEKKLLKETPQAAGGKYIPGLTGGTIPGMAPPGGKAAASQSLVAAPLPMPPKFEGAEAAAPKSDNSTMVQIKVPDDKIGIVIGPKGSKIKMIQEKTGVNRIDTSGEMFTITGPADAVGMAEQAINDLITKGYTHLTFDDFAENFVMVYSNKFPDLIGKQGVVIRAIKEQLGVEVSIPKTGPPGKPWKVTIAGSNKNAEKAKEVIESIVKYSHHEITHPGEDHAELDIPSWAYSFIIGKAGSELRHIQNNYKVKVNIPRDWDDNDKVIIVGDKLNVERATVYVQKLLSGAEDAAKGRDRQEKTEDPWGAEEPEEDWMKQYMYKRK
jgi:rRNA processing protein Krr1/Pno1